MGKLVFSSAAFCVLAAVVCSVVGVAFELTPQQIKFLGLFSGLYIYAAYFAPRFHELVEKNNERINEQMKQELDSANAQSETNSEPTRSDYKPTNEIATETPSSEPKGQEGE